MFKGTLYPFQVEARDRMLERKLMLVAYEMGLGKTVITLSALEELFDAGEIGGGLVIVLASLKYQWAAQIEKFSDRANYIVIDGTPAQRIEQYDKASRGWFDYIILNYEQVVNEFEIVRRLPRDFVVCDEVTYIKSFRAKRSRRTKKLKAEYRFGLTGQPVENRPEEVYSIMEWVDPDVLGPFDIFDKTFIKRDKWSGRVRYYKNLPTLHKGLSEAMVRKTREDPDVRDFLPDVVEEQVLVEFDSAGASLYRKIATDLQAEIASAVNMFGSFNLWAHYGQADDKRAMQVQGRIMSRLTCLRMLCDHPELLRISASLFDDSQSGKSGTKGGSQYAYALKESGRLDVLRQTPKLKATVELLQEILSANPRNKVVLFSFFKPTLKLIQKATEKLCESVLFTGDMDAKAKDRSKRQFDSDPSTRLFLSSDAGGYGVDLPAANYLVSYNLPWSAGKLDQRNARIIRLSSDTQEVTLISMLMLGSIEEHYYSVLEMKRRIASAVTDGKGIDRQGRLNIDLDSLNHFLEGSTV